MMMQHFPSLYNIQQLSDVLKLILSCHLSNDKSDWSGICVEDDWVNLYAFGLDCLHVEFFSQVMINEAAFSNSSISNEYELDLGNLLFSMHDNCGEKYCSNQRPTGIDFWCFLWTKSPHVRTGHFLSILIFYSNFGQNQLFVK